MILMFLIILLGSVLPVQAQEPSPATMWREGEKVLFWQTNHVTGGMGGLCCVRFGFYGEALKEPIEGLTLAIRTIDKSGTDLGVAKVTLERALGGPRVDRYQEVLFCGVNKWPNQNDGKLSPLCYEQTTLLIESATGKQGNKVVDLVRFGQLEFTTFQKIKVKVKQ